MKRILPALVCGFGAGVLNTVPLVNFYFCCLIVPVAAIISLVLDQRANREDGLIRPGKAVQLGLLTGIFTALFSTLFEVIIIFVTKYSGLEAALPAMEKSLSEIIPAQAARNFFDTFYKIKDDISNYGFSFMFTLLVLLSSLLTNTILGIVGGLFGMQFLNKRKREL